METDPFLSDKAKVIDIRQATVQDNLMKVDVEFVSNRAWDGSFQYKFEWFDNQGMPVESQMSTWITRHVEPQEQFSVTATAPDPRCKDFRLKLQRQTRG